MFKNIILFLFFVITGTFSFILFYELKNSSVKSSVFTPKKPSFSLQNPPSDSLKGEITSLFGSVSYQGRGADYGSAIKAKRQIVQGDEISTLGSGRADISFNLVGKISLLPKTHINIVQTLPQNFVSELTEGEAKFEKSGNIPFTIRSLDLGINLNDQTKVDVKTDKEKSQVSFIVNNGQVTFYYTDTSNQTTVIPARKGKEIIFDNNTKTFKVKPL